MAFQDEHSSSIPAKVLLSASILAGTLVSSLPPTLYEQFAEADQHDLPAEASAQAGATVRKNSEVLEYGG